ncbi:MAG: hypothetical protein WCW78_00530 [Candidatus Paceibacterota bacterium]|jgi:hypothetical protein
MQRTLKIVGWLIGIPLVITFLVATLGFLAVRYNFWPPNCDILPIPQAKRVCEFSKREKVKMGTPTVVQFWVGIPESTSPSDIVYFVPEGKSQLAMKKVGDTSYEVDIPAMIGEEFSYRYRRDEQESFSDIKNIKIGILGEDVFDAVSAWSDDKKISRIATSTRIIVNTMDTWTINYNFNFFEDTRNNIESTMVRAKALGANELGVFSFIEVLGNKDSFTLQGVDTPFKYMRDAAISAGDMKKLAKLGKEYGLDIVIHYNTEADYTKYFNVKDFRIIGAGVGGAAAHGRAAKELGIDEPKSKEWIDMWFDGLEPVLLMWAKNAEVAGIYGIDITPQYMVPKFAPQEAYADTRYKEIIGEMRKVYKGKIVASSFGWFGGITDRNKATYINDVDALYVPLPPLKVREGASLAEMRAIYTKNVIALQSEFNAYPKGINLIIAQASYKGAINGVPSFEYNDFAEARAKGHVADWQAQADSYDAALSVLSRSTFFKGIGTSGYWFDDFMDPNYADPLISMHPSIRNKPAEAVWKKWVNPVEPVHI